MRLAGMAGTAASLALLVLAGAAVAHVVKYKTDDVTIRHDAAAGTLSGQVSANKSACRANRKVVVLSDAPGADTEVGSARTDSSGEWSINAGNVPPSEYYADADRKTLKLTVDHRHVCTAVRSDSIAVGR
jgi:hypothetical protein